eukprot:9484661-Pyramimonas_sp.AAC.1
MHASQTRVEVGRRKVEDEGRDDCGNGIGGPAQDEGPARMGHARRREAEEEKEKEDDEEEEVEEEKEEEEEHAQGNGAMG